MTIKRRTIFYHAPEGMLNVPADEDISTGPQQVEALLHFIVDRSTERALEDAELDNRVYDALGEHRILGKKKRKKMVGSKNK